MVTVASSEYGPFGEECHRGGDTRSGARREKRRSYASLRAHVGCVWCVTVKDPRRFPNKRHCTGPAMPPKGRPQTERAQPVREAQADTCGEFSTSKADQRIAPVSDAVAQAEPRRRPAWPAHLDQ